MKAVRSDSFFHLSVNRWRKPLETKRAGGSAELQSRDVWNRRKPAELHYWAKYQGTNDHPQFWTVIKPTQRDGCMTLPVTAVNPSHFNFTCKQQPASVMNTGTVSEYNHIKSLRPAQLFNITCFYTGNFSAAKLESTWKPGLTKTAGNKRKQDPTRESDCKQTDFV